MGKERDTTETEKMKNGSKDLVQKMVTCALPQQAAASVAADDHLLASAHRAGTWHLDRTLGDERWNQAVSKLSCHRCL